jgi:histone H3/H4
LLFPKRPFHRLVREIAQDYSGNIRFTHDLMKALQEAAKIFVTETFHKADMA